MNESILSKIELEERLKSLNPEERMIFILLLQGFSKKEISMNYGYSWRKIKEVVEKVKQGLEGGDKDD